MDCDMQLGTVRVKNSPHVPGGTGYLLSYLEHVGICCDIGFARENQIREDPF